MPKIAFIVFPGWPPKGTRAVSFRGRTLLMVPRRSPAPGVVRSYEVRTAGNRPLGWVSLFRRDADEPGVWRAFCASSHAGDLGLHPERRGAVASLMGAYSEKFWGAV